jgi:HAD superfamily hydrolase (TIGR01490 family)
MNKIAVFDIDGTIYREAMSFIVAEELLERFDFPEEKAKLDEARHIFKSRESTEAYWTYNKAILEVCKQVFKQTSPEIVRGVIDDLLTQRQKYCYAYTTQLVARLKAEGRTLVAISGSIANIIEPFAKSLGFDYVVASALEVVDGKFTGERASTTHRGKDQILKDLVAEHGLTLEDSIGVGDTHRDISMLSMTARPIAFNPNAALYEEAQKQGWQVVLERKNMIYELTPGTNGYMVKDAHPIFNDNHQEHLR